MMNAAEPVATAVAVSGSCMTSRGASDAVEDCRSYANPLALNAACRIVYGGRGQAMIEPAGLSGLFGGRPLRGAR